MGTNKLHFIIVLSSNPNWASSPQCSCSMRKVSYPCGEGFEAFARVINAENRKALKLQSLSFGGGVASIE